SSSMTMYVNDVSNPCTVEQSFTITINPSPTISGPTSVCPGASILLTGTGTPDGTTPWTSSNTGVATVDNAGNVTGVAVGSTTITYLDANGCSDTYVVNVTAAPVLDPVTNVTACDSFQLAPITGTGLTGNEAYYSGTGGTGTQYAAGDWISSSMTMYVNDVSNPCTVEQSFTITINPSPTISGPTSVCPGASILLTGTGTPDGTTPWTSSNTGVATVDNAGNVTGVSGGATTITYLDNNGCSDTYTVNVVAAPDITPISTLTDCDSIQLPAIAGTNLTGGQAYYDGTGGTGTMYTAGQWISSSITLYAYDISGGCADEETVNIVIETTPIAAFTANPISGCSTPHTVFFTDNSTLPDTWFWDFGDANTSTAQNPIHSYTAFGTFTVTLTVTDTINGCSDQASTTITVNTAPVIDPQANIAGCDSIQLPPITGTGLTGNEAYYSGTGGTGTQYAAGDWISSSMTMYINDLSNACTVEQTFTITVNSSPTISGPTAVCPGSSILLTGTGTPDGTTPWTSSNTGVATVDNAGNVTGVAAGSTTITYLDANGCSNTYVVNVSTAPVLDPVTNVTECDSFQLAPITGTGLTGNEAYYSGAGGTGTQYAAGQWISSSMTMYVNDISNPCTVEQSFSITINPSPTISGGTTVCESSVLALNGTGTPDPVTPWTSSNTGVATVDNVGNVTGVAAGTTDITYTDNNGCSNTITVTVNATPTIAGNAPLCAGATNTLTGSGTPDGTTPWTSSDPSVATIDNAGLVSAVGAGTTTITYLEVNGCSTTEVVTVNAAPNLVISDPAAVCEPSTVDLTDPAVTAGSDPGTLTYWTDTTATTTLTGPNTVATTNTYFIQLDDGSCTTILPVVVMVNPIPVLTLTDPAPVCDPSLVDLTDPAVTSGSDPGTFTYFDGMGNTVATPTAVSSGTYFITLTDGNGCQNAGQVTATVNPSPTLVVTDPAAVCEPSTIDLTDPAVTAGSDPGTLTYWSDAGATTTVATPNGVTGGMYYIQLEDGNGCTAIEAVTATVNPQDDASFMLAPTCDGATATILGTSGGSFALLSSTSATIDPSTGTVTGGAYNEVLDVEYTTTGSCPNSATETVVIDDCTPQDLIIPTAFTPGADGAHDTWEIVGLDNLYPNNRVTVYNRWGNKVFEHNASSADPYSNNMWDGTFNGAQLPVASYYYIIETNDASSTEKYEGTVTILQ
ncbi:MAG: Ig-like domain-containing protein, partial [bacterium]|nr:Ig-like domain-containing protein [bacterium]